MINCSSVLLLHLVLTHTSTITYATKMEGCNGVSNVVFLKPLDLIDTILSAICFFIYLTFIYTKIIDKLFFKFVINIEIFDSMLF